MVEEPEKTAVTSREKQEDQQDVRDDEDNSPVIEVTPQLAAWLYEQTKNGNTIEVAIQHNETHHYYPDGPRLPVRELEDLNEIGPEVLERFLTMMERGHDSELENDKALREDKKQKRTLEQQGLWGGILLATIMGCFGLIALYMGSPGVSGTIFGTTIATALAIVITKKPLRLKEKPDN